MLTAAVSMLASSPAEAHVRSGAVAADYRASVFPVSPAATHAIRVRIAPSDRAISLTVVRGNDVTVLGPSGTAMRTIDARRLGSETRTVTWHDSRLRGLPAGVREGRWSLPLIVDGARTQLEGEIWRVQAPPVWPWWLVGVPFLVVTALAVVRITHRPEPAIVLLAGLAAVATVAIAVGFAVSSSASAGRMLEGFDELAVAAVGVGFLVHGPGERRLIAAVALGFLAVFAAGLKVAVLVHGLVLSALPATVARASVAVALWAGFAVIVTAGWLLVKTAQRTTVRGPRT